MRRLAFAPLIAGFLIGMRATSALAIQPQVGDVKDSRTTGQFFSGLEIQLKLLGDDAADVHSARVTIEQAADDSGRDLLDPQKASSDFNEIGKFGNQGIPIQLKNPARKATSVKLKGKLEVFEPKLDPHADVHIPAILSKTGTELKDPALSAAGISLTVLTKADYEKARAEEKKLAEANVAKQGIAAGMAAALQSAFSGMMTFGDNTLAYKVADPNKKLIAIRLLKSDSQEVRRNSWQSSGPIRQYQFGEPIPADASLEVLVATPQSTAVVPLDLANIILP